MAWSTAPSSCCRGPVDRESSSLPEPRRFVPAFRLTVGGRSSCSLLEWTQVGARSFSSDLGFVTTRAAAPGPGCLAPGAHDRRCGRDHDPSAPDSCTWCKQRGRRHPITAERASGFALRERSSPRSAARRRCVHPVQAIPDRCIGCKKTCTAGPVGPKYGGSLGRRDEARVAVRAYPRRASTDRLLTTLLVSPHRDEECPRPPSPARRTTTPGSP